MTTVHVRRTSIALTVLFTGAAILFGALDRQRGRVAPDPVPGDAGRTAFEARCSACHTTAALIAPVRTASDRRAKLEEIAALLAGGHGDASEEEARAVLRYLDELAGR
jgi:mono/diheme cytochrome c family protein